MLQWLIMAVLTAAASLALLLPLYRGRAAAANNEAEAAIYRDQLRELDREVERGVIGAEEAEAARTEIGRRLLRAADAAAPRREPASDQRRSIAALVALVLVPVSAVSFYLWVGKPEAADQPLAARLEATPDTLGDIDAMVAMVEARLAADPEEGQGWDVIAPVYAATGRFNEAARAYLNAIRLLGSSAEREAGLATALTEINGGVVTEAARQGFQRSLDLDPSNVTSRFYLALGLHQDGQDAASAAAWRALIADAPAGANWLPAAQAQLALVDPTAPPPQIPDEQRGLIETMVGSLADRLRLEPNDPEGWAMLIRSYKVLERDEDALLAVADAKAALATDPQQIAAIDALARELGLAVN